MDFFFNGEIPVIPNEHLYSVRARKRDEVPDRVQIELNLAKKLEEEGRVVSDSEWVKMCTEATGFNTGGKY